MKRQLRKAWLGALLGAPFFVMVHPAAGAVVKVGFIQYEGAANANGNFLTKIVARDAACSTASVFENTQAYDNVAGGATPTTNTEIRDFTKIGLAAIAPAGYSVQSHNIGGVPMISITASTPGGAAFDVCVDGTKILGTGVTASYVENGVTVSGFSKSKGTPGFCSFNYSGKGAQCVSDIDEAVCIAEGGIWSETACIPTVSQWGVAVMTLLVLTAATVVIMRRRAAVA